MLGISYETWVNICKNVLFFKHSFSKGIFTMVSFTKVSDEDKEYIMSRDFYKRYIETSSFVFFRKLCNNLKIICKK